MFRETLRSIVVHQNVMSKQRVVILRMDYDDIKLCSEETRGLAVK